MDSELRWHRAACSTSNQAAEAARAADGSVLLRNAANPDAVLRFTADEWVSFIGGAVNGNFDHTGTTHKES